MPACAPLGAPAAAPERLPACRALAVAAQPRVGALKARIGAPTSRL
jgi:hypothetical protein